MLIFFAPAALARRDLLTYVGAPPTLGRPAPSLSQTEAYLATRAGVTVIKEEMKRTFDINDLLSARPAIPSRLEASPGCWRT